LHADWIEEIILIHMFQVTKIFVSLPDFQTLDPGTVRMIIVLLQSCLVNLNTTSPFFLKKKTCRSLKYRKPLNAELNPICCLLALLGAHHFLHVSRIRVKSLTVRLLMSYIHGAPILDVSRSHTTTHHSR